MTEYISRENTLDVIREMSQRYTDETLAEFAYNIVSNIPSEDVQPIRRGRWIDIYEWAKMHDSKPSGICTYYWCSKCQTEQEKKSNFCPNCGARMDGANATKG